MKSIIPLLMLSLALLTGCPKVVKTRPSTKFSQNELITQVNGYLQNRQMAYYCAMTGNHVNYNLSSFSYEKVYTCGSPRTVSGVASEEDRLVARRIRDEAIDSGIMAVNTVYGDFIDDLNKGRSNANFVADVIDLGTSAAIGISKGERPLQILGIALTAFRGGRKSANLNFFREQSTPILINKMDDNRSTLHASIILKKQKGADAYTMAEAIRDIVDYYNAGTLVRAFTQLSKDTAAQALESEKRVLQLQNIDPDDIVVIPDETIVWSEVYDQLLDEYVAILKPATTATPEKKTKATGNLRLIYKDISKDVDLKDALEKTKLANPTFVEDMKKLENEDQTEAKALSGLRILSLINRVRSSLNLQTDGARFKKIVEHFKTHPIE